MESVHVVYEDDHVCCILDHDPFNEGHLLILPKAHVEDVDDMDAETADAVMAASRHIAKAIKRLYQPDGITICQNGGLFNELTHFHMHVVPRYKHQSFADFYLDTSLNNEDTKKQLHETKTKLSTEIHTLL